MLIPTTYTSHQVHKPYVIDINMILGVVLTVLPNLKTGGETISRKRRKKDTQIPALLRIDYLPVVASVFPEDGGDCSLCVLFWLPPAYVSSHVCLSVGSGYNF